MWLQRERKYDVIWSDMKLGGYLELNAILLQSWNKIRLPSKLTSLIGSNISRSSPHTTLCFLQVKHQNLQTNLRGLLSHVHILIFSRSNLKLRVFGLFSRLLALWSLGYLHPKNQQTTRVSTELEMLVNLLYSFIPLQIILQIVVDRPVENPRKRTENMKMAPNALNKFYWRMHGQNGSLSTVVII